MIKQLKFNTAIPLSLYIHVPWCIRKCPYCDFNSHTIKKQLPEQAYIDALIADFEQDLPKIWGRRLVSIFIGGGTPSLFSGAAIHKLLTALQTRLAFKFDIEITMEANPGTVEHDNFQHYLDAGINRLSLGVQSFQTNKLKRLGRIHDAEQAISAIKMVKQLGYKNINIDLMHGLPQQSKADALFDLTQACELKPQHISWYQLTIEPNTVFYRHTPKLPNKDACWEIETAGKELLTQHNYLQYEVSAYAMTNSKCIHNQNYWEFGDYLGIGAGAHSKITDMATHQVMRFSKIRQPQSYLNTNKKFIANKTILTNKDISFDFLLNHLRLHQAVNHDLFQQRCGQDISCIADPLARAEQQGLITRATNSFATTAKGRAFLNDLLMLFM